MLSLDESLDILRYSEAWLEEMVMKSGNSRLFVRCFPALLDEFASFIRLRGEERTVCSEADAKRRFYYWLVSKPGKDFFAGRERGQPDDDASGSRFKTLVDGKRTYCGYILPDDAPPCPDAYRVWYEELRRWER